MKGLRIFTHSVKLVFGNFGMALRISGVLYLGGILILGVAVAIGYVRLGDTGMANGAVPVGWLAMGLAALAFCLLWLVVPWHRFVLLNEVPTRLVPRFNGGAILAYFGRVLLVIFPILLAVLGVAIAIGVATAIAPHAPMATGPWVVFPALVATTTAHLIVYRIGPILPAAALRTELSVAEAWRRTAGNWGSLLVLALVGDLFEFALDIPKRFLLPEFSGAVLSILTTWVKLMVGVSILTTLYGHFVEGRELR